MEDLNDGLRAILTGTLDLSSLPQMPSKVIRIYLSSTVSDMLQEKRKLIEDVIPKLRNYCREKYGVEFQVIDLRWGQSDEWPDDSEARELYWKEILECQNTSAGPSFVTLLGQRYGHTPLPSTILEDDFTAILDALRQHRSRETRDAALLEKWYKRDQNCIPPVFRLHMSSSELITRSMMDEGKTQKTWPEIKGKLRALLETGLELAFGTENPQRKSQYLMSDLEREIRLGVMHCKDPKNDCLAFTRSIVDLKNYMSHEAAQKFIEVKKSQQRGKDCVVAANEKRVEYLKQDILKHWLPNENCADHEVLWKFNEGIDRKLHSDYLSRFTEKFTSMMTEKIDRLCDELNATPLPPMMEEVFQQWHLTQEECSTFCREVRDDVIDKIRDYVTGTTMAPLVLFGMEGSGKTAIMAQAAAEAADWFTGESMVVIRFAGKTPLSKDDHQLVTSLSLQIACILQMPPEEVPKSWKELQKYFTTLLATIPKGLQLVIFLDGLDQMDTQHNKQSLNWLPSQLQENVKVILSINPISPNAAGLIEQLQSNSTINKPSSINIGPLDVHSCMRMIEHWLQRDNKAIQPEQMESLRRAFSNCSVPLYVKIMYEEVKTWTSDTDTTDVLFPTTVYESIMTLFERLEKKHGQLLTKHVLCYLTASDTGLSDSEMEDILSIDDRVLDEHFHGKTNVIRRIAPIAWLRLKNDIRPYIKKMRCDDMTVYSWNHIIFTRLIHQRYMCDKTTKAEIHSNLADYFLGIWSKGPKTYVVRGENKVAEIQAPRYVSAQPMSFGSDRHLQRFNTRKFDQVPRQLSLSGRLEEFNQHVLFNYDWLYNKVKALSIEHVLKDFSLNPGAEAKLLGKALEEAQPYLSSDIDTMAAEISGRLLSYYDTHPNIRQLIQECDTMGLKHCALLPNFQCHKVPGSPLMFNLSLLGNPDSLILAGQTSRYLLTKTSTKPYMQIYDLTSGHQVAEVLTSAGWIMATPSANQCLIVDDDTRKSIKVHDSLTGEFKGQFIPLTQIQLVPKQKYELQKIAICETHMCALVTADTSYLCVAELETYRFTHVKRLEAKASILEFTPDSRFIFCNAGETLLSFDLLTMDNICQVGIETIPKQIIFRDNALRAFVINELENKIYIMHLVDGKVDMMYKVVLTDQFNNDQLCNLSLSRDQELLLVRGKDNLVVYHVSTEKVLCHIMRPQDIPGEFKLPKSKMKPIHFNNALFSADCKFVIGTIFRSIYIWHSNNGKLLTTLQAPVGMVQALLVPVDRSQLVTHMEGSDSVQIWSLGDAIGHAEDLDKLTAPVEEIKFSQSGKEAYIKCKDSDEVGVLNMTTGNLQDLLTHPSAVVSLSATNDGSHLFVATSPGKNLKNLNKIWNLSDRNVIYEFGSAPAFNTSLHDNKALICIEQEDLTFKAPYNICIFTFDDDDFNQYQVDQQVNFVLSEPFVTPSDKYLVLLSADDYEPSSDNHINPKVCALSLRDMSISQYSAEDLKDVVRISRMLHVRPVENNPYNVIILFTNEPDIVDRDDHRRRTGYDYCFGFLIFDICSGVVCQILEDFISPRTPLDQVIFSKDVSFCIDNESNMFNMATGFYLKRITKSKVRPKALLLGGRVVLYMNGSHVYIVRIVDGTQIGQLDLHERITSVAVGPDDRTIVLGCESGSLMSYVMIDEKYDDSSRILSSLESRNQKTENSPYKIQRSWDKLQLSELKTDDQRPNTVQTIGPTDRQYLEQVRPASRFRPTSDTILYLNSSSRSCSVM